MQADYEARGELYMREAEAARDEARKARTHQPPEGDTDVVTDERAVQHFEALELSEQLNFLRRLTDAMADQCEVRGDGHGLAMATHISTALDS